MSTNAIPVSEEAVNSRAEAIILATLQKHGIARAELPQTSIDDARRVAREQVEDEQSRASNPYRALYEQERAAHQLTQSQLSAVKTNQNRDQTRYTAPVSAERARARMGELAWMKSTDNQKLVAIGLDPASIDRAELRKLFGKGADTHTVVEFQKSQPQLYANLREAAKVLHVYGG